MKAEINLTNDWLLIRSEESLLRVKSYLKGVDAPPLFELGNRLLTKMDQLEEGEWFELLKSEKYWDLTLIYESRKGCLLKSDIVRSTPLFYILNENKLSIYDRLRFSKEFELNPESIYELINSNFTLGSSTIYKNIAAIQSAEILSFVDGKVKNERYFRYDIDQETSINELGNISEVSKYLDQIFCETFQGLIDSISGNGRIIVPLSGGRDSRMVVNYLYKLGYRDVICYSYGLPGNIQSEISKRVAGALGYEWYFIEYTEEKWQEVYEEELFDQYVELGCNGVSNPHLQDFLAVYELDKRGLLNRFDVFVPGHGLDMLSNNIDITFINESVLNRAVARYSRDKNNVEGKVNPLFTRIKSIYDKSEVSDAAFLDYLHWQERQSKFIINSFRVYEFFGYEAKAIFWDYRLVRFWLSVNKNLKYKSDFISTLEKETLLVDDLKEIPLAKVRTINNKKEKKSHKKYVPDFLIILYLRLTKAKQDQDEGLNLIYSKRAKTVKELISPLDEWPEQVINLFKKDLYRYPYQINHHFLTRLYTVSKVYKSNIPR
jgi:asparagine synthase (glutamine-hydrolysing)